MQYYLHDEVGNIYQLSPSGEIYAGPNHIAAPSGQWRAVKLQHIVDTTWKLDIVHILTSLDDWEIYARNKWFKNGLSQWRLIDYDHGTTRLWRRRVSLTRIE
jgi:hypothetical protein